MVVGRSLSEIYMVMEYVEHDLKQLSESMKQPFSIAEVRLPVFIPTASGVCLDQELLIRESCLADVTVRANVTAVYAAKPHCALHTAC